MSERIILKVSGESLSNKKEGLDIDYEIVKNLANEIKQLHDLDYEIGIVVGGGNFWRGASAAKNGIERNKADYIGMLATVMNGLALQGVFNELSIPTKVQSAIEMNERVVAGYIQGQADIYLKEKNIVIFVGGTGRPFFTTDSTASLVASELGAKKILMAKNGVDGVYDSDPKTNPNAKFFEEITYKQMIELDLKVMDSTASSISRDNGIETIVFNIKGKDAIVNAITGKTKSTRITK
ncbi:MAG: UMP kinase [Mycoplasma sp.]|nr:UMP kinase [Mycoplasma sp.]